ncbi:MAG: UDP-N-acetylmuramate dehydrogenase [Myxococcales bacterium]
MSLLGELQRFLGGRVEASAPLAPRTSVRVGGAAELLASPATLDALATLLAVCADRDVPYRVLGGGANTIVSDEGVRGVVVKLPPELFLEESGEDAQGPWVKLGAGQPIASLLRHAKAKGLTGMEFMAGIPGTIGGAVAMNAGTKTGWTGNIVEELAVCEPAGPRVLAREEVGFRYRHTSLSPLAVVVWAKFRLQRGDVTASRAAMEQDLANRKRTQPLNLPNSGSVFRNPDGDFAARLVEASGLKGLRQGDAQISEVHANFIVNRGEAKASDVVALMKRMQDEVRARHGVQLVPEVKLFGEFDPAGLPAGLTH